MRELDDNSQSDMEKGTDEPLAGGYLCDLLYL